MNLSPENFSLEKINKRTIIIGSIGLFVLFFILSFVFSYFEYQSEGPRSEEPLSSYDEASFKRLHEQLTKDQPQRQDQSEVLAEIVEESKNKPIPYRKSSYNYTKGSYDTLAVNCSILLDKYQELVVKYEELEKKVNNKGAFAARKTPPRSTRSTPTTSAAKSSNGGFDYTRYIRSSSSNELSNSGGALSSAQYTWATLSLPQSQRVFDQSIVTFNVAEPFTLEGTEVPRSARVEGVAQLNRGRGRIFITFTRLYTLEQTITIEGEAYGLDRARGLNVLIQGESSLAESIKRETTDLVGLVDPSRTNMSRTIIQDTDVGREEYGSLDAGTMILANIRKR